MTGQVRRWCDHDLCWNLLLSVVRANRANVFVYGLALQTREDTCRLAMSYILSTICLLTIPYYFGILVSSPGCSNNLSAFPSLRPENTSGVLKQAKKENFALHYHEILLVSGPRNLVFVPQPRQAPRFEYQRQIRGNVGYEDAPLYPLLTLVYGASVEKTGAAVFTDAAQRSARSAYAGNLAHSKSN
jgi:hypothetical protein